ncbi:MAG TPA: VIT domain-containing protein [Kofleriaceae bacterium]
MNHDESRDVLEENVSSLLETGGEAPRIADGARARIREALVAKLGVAAAPPPRTRMRVPVFAVLGGLAATAVVALIALRIFGGGAGGATGGEGSPALADGSTFLTAPGGKVTVLGLRHVRVEGAALLDVTPGHGPFTVETARGRIEVLGTKFYVDGEAERTVAAVVRGSVKLASDGGEVLLHAGEQGIAEAGRAPVRGPAPRLSYLASWAEQARREADRSLEPLHHGTLFARDAGVRSHPPWGQEYPLPIAKLGVDIVVEDRVARVALDQTFHNDAAQDLEGVYRFAIPPDAALQRLAMYNDGQLEEAAVVERMQARRIYESLVYRRIDPALLEWAGNGRLALRVYPIRARQDKRLALAYTQSLPELYDDWTLTVPLPEVDQPVGEFAVAMRIKGCASCEISSTSHQIVVTRDGDDAIVSYRRSADKLGDSFVVHVRDPRRDTRVATHTDGADRFVLVRAKSDVGGAPQAYRPRTWVVLDDVSASRSTLELRAQQDFIASLARELDEDDKLAVIAFDVEARTKLAPTRVADIDRRALRDALTGEGGVGATDFSVALAAATKTLAGVPPDDAMIVYLGDGVITAGPRELDALRAQLAGKAHFVGVGLGDGPDTQTLGALAAATGGYTTTIDLADDVAWRAFDLVAALHTSRVTGVEAKLVDAAGQVVPATAYLRSPQLADGEEVELVAKLSAPATPAALLLTGTRAGAPWQQTIALPPAHEGGYLPRLWAERHIAARLLAKHDPIAPELREARDEAIRKEVVALGKRYFLLSRHTSLLVLENDAMYAQFGVQKGAGETWAPYALPARIPVAPVVASSPQPAGDAGDAELVRQPLALFYEQPNNLRTYGPMTLEDGILATDESGGFTWAHGAGTGTGLGRGGMGGDGGGAVGLGMIGTRADLSLEAQVQTKAVAREDQPFDDGKLAKAEAMVTAQRSSSHFSYGGLRGRRTGADDWSEREKSLDGGAALSLQRLASAYDGTFDDVTAFVPALVRDAFDTWRERLGSAGAHSIAPAARDLLERARRALPAGVYRWGTRELAVDGAHRLGWRRTTEDGLAETASFDGTTWTRRYAELGLDATRAVGDADVALALAYLPIWIAEPAHYARWFDVSVHGREVVLTATEAGKPRTAFVLVFDERARLVAVRDGSGSTLLAVTWDATGPTAARARGEALAVGYTADAIADAPAWAHGSSRPGVVVELPLRVPASWHAALAGESAGTPAWQHAERQLLASLAATNDRAALWTAFGELRAHADLELGDVALASGGIAGQRADAIGKALGTLAHEPLGSYLAAAYAYRAGERPAAAAHDGFIGALWSLRAAEADTAAQRGKAAADELAAIDPRAPRLRFVGAEALSNDWELPVADIARVADGAALGDYANLAHALAAQALANRGDYEDAAAQAAALAAEPDLHARPARLDQEQYWFQASRRGTAGWHLAWSAARDGALAGDSLAHVMALLPLAPQHPADLPALLARAAELAGDDIDAKLAVARAAIGAGQGEWARQLIAPLVTTAPSHEVYQELAQIELADGQVAAALGSLESAEDAGADEQVDISMVRGELGQIIAVAQQLALQSSGAARSRAVERALHWGDRWRAIDPGNTEIDRALGELELAVGDRAAAWRQMSSMIERDPWSGAGYMEVAAAFEAQGRVGDALPFWHQAVIIDQTNPTPRLAEARALIALGRTKDGDAELADITSRHWHDMWSGVVYQAQDLLARGKRR